MNVYESSTTQGNFTQPIPLAAGAVIEAGSVFGIDASGNAVGALTNAVRIGGRATTAANNTGGDVGAVSVVGELCAIELKNSAVSAVVKTNIMTSVWLEDQNTVRGTTAANRPIAGRFLGFTKAGNCVVDLAAASLL
jgi:hypothetical protein